MTVCTGKDDLTRRVTHSQAVFRLVIHSILDAWHYKVLWTCALTTLQWYTCNYVCLILCIMLHSTNLKSNCQMHFLPHSQLCSEVHSWLHSTVHSQPAWLTLSRCSQVNSKYAPKYTPGHALQDASNCTRWHTPSLLDCMLPSKFSRSSQTHSRACSQVHSQLHSMAHSQPA